MKRLNLYLVLMWIITQGLVSKDYKFLHTIFFMLCMIVYFVYQFILTNDKVMRREQIRKSLISISLISMILVAYFIFGNNVKH